MMKTERCPDNCNYKGREAAFCGFCMRKILEERSDRKDGNRQTETEDPASPDKLRSGHGKEDNKGG